MSDVSNAAAEKKSFIENAYNVTVDVKQNIEQCYTDQQLMNAQTKNTYCISEDDLETSIKITMALIRFKQLIIKQSSQNATKHLIAKADSQALEIGHKIEQIRQNVSSISGKQPSLRVIAMKLNEEKVLTQTGKEKWHPQSVKSVEARHKKLTNTS